jgi:hypothetical protein
VAVWLLAFLAASSTVVWRQTAARRAARELRSLETARGALETGRAARGAAIRHAQSRAVLIPLAERRLRMRLPHDSEIVILLDPRSQ